MSETPVSAAGTRLLRLQAVAPTEPNDCEILVVDTTWLARGDERAVGAVQIAGDVLAGANILADATACLDDWAAASDVIPLLAIDGTTFWFYDRLVHAKWLHDAVLWLRIIARVVEERRVDSIECDPEVERQIVDMARLVAAARGLPFSATEPPPRPPKVTEAPSLGPWARRLAPVRERLRAVARRFWPQPEERRRRRLLSRIDRLGREEDPRLLVLLQHAPQRIDTAEGSRVMNAYLGPIVDRLRGSRLAPIELDIKRASDRPGARSDGPAGRRLPPEAIDAMADPTDLPSATATASGVAEAVRKIRRPMVFDGIDLGPTVTKRVAAQARRTFVRQAVAVRRIRRLLRRLRPAGILLAVEYNRTEWLAAARQEGIPLAAVQHGIIHGQHNGYRFPARPAELVLPERTYVFGRWERDVLVRESVYREEEVIATGSPRLDLVPTEHADAGTLRAQLGIAPGERMLVVSGTWGESYRRFYFPLALARLVDRPLPGVHIVIKLHPGEPDEGPYRRVIENAAAAGGFAPPPVTVVQAIDLYRLLAAADAHFGIHSTVLTEAVTAGTLNLIADMFAGSDMLDYVASGVAVPVRNGGDVIAALDRRDELVPSDEARRAFLEEHFRPGDASDRIVADLFEWLDPAGRA